MTTLARQPNAAYQLATVGATELEARPASSFTSHRVQRQPARPRTGHFPLQQTSKSAVVSVMYNAGHSETARNVRRDLANAGRPMKSSGLNVVLPHRKSSNGQVKMANLDDHCVTAHTRGKHSSPLPFSRSARHRGASQLATGACHHPTTLIKSLKAWLRERWPQALRPRDMRYVCPRRSTVCPATTSACHAPATSPRPLSTPLQARIVH
ncbi:hypothetical protein HYPSUDRAFT_612214 [Hypholoma sublateritium FD-334 SS-4]|uniref:Uncharacterized protein n=1 Tax=Hypholoma sublateritium (strain FD-334 SS-4) TaxID=945553 RepID=A0A0D2MH43_HYPSF|nr:hypothetical protein HYPSUDRAFT_612214 [Hypholoma sublateritium FD-334 SS-4]